MRAYRTISRHSGPHLVQRQQSIATIEGRGGLFFPIVSHCYDHAWTLTAYETEARAKAYVEGIWPGLMRWLSVPDFNAAMREQR